VTEDQLWAPGPLNTLVAALVGSPSLAPVHAVQLLYVHFTPAPEPPNPTPGAPAAVVVPPTKTFSVRAVVVNHGNVGESGLTVSAQLVPAGASTGAIRRQTISLTPGGSVAVALTGWRVVPGSSYVINVEVSPPEGQVDRAELSSVIAFTVGPAT
jgi:hypothetical protein